MNLASHVVAVAVLCAPVSAGTLHADGFEGTAAPGSSQGTGGGDLSFRDVWTLTRSLAADADGQHARFDFSVPSEPAEPDTYWYGGLSTVIGDFVTLPPVWELSFRVATSSTQPEALRVTFSFVEEPADGRGTRGEGSRLRCWVALPPGDGWQQVVVRSGEVEFSGFTFSTSESAMTAKLAVAMSSHGPAGEAQSLAGVGAHFLLIDDLVLRIPVTPFVSLHPRPDGRLSLFHSGVLQAGDDPGSWAAPSPQPPPHSIIDPGGARRFFRATAD